MSEQLLDAIRQMCVGRTIVGVDGDDEFIRFTFDNGGYQEFRIGFACYLPVNPKAQAL